ncbi:unnamed protein product [Cuscuta campestris]|uniref:Retrotransposon gag domain-containing protein n=1 Tax=Cuscuta campestris TaxID=132261 RepID=A0A484LWH7_9ASTE|nr:unnamed protein product [Cuscuta campestris]
MTVTAPISACQDDLDVSLNDVTSQNTTDLRHRIPRRRAANVEGLSNPLNRFWAMMRAMMFNNPMAGFQAPVSMPQATFQPEGRREGQQNVVENVELFAHHLKGLMADSRLSPLAGEHDNKAASHSQQWDNGKASERRVNKKQTSRRDMDTERRRKGRPSVVNGGASRPGDERIDFLLQRIDALEKRSGHGYVTEPTFRLRSPFSERILKAPLPGSFQMPVIPRSFPATLDGLASEWFNELLEGKIDSWEDLARRFLVHFAGNKKKKLHFSHLLSVRQRLDEPLKEFLARWKLETTKRLALEKPKEYSITLAMAEDEAETEELEANKKKEEAGRLGTMVATTRPPARKAAMEERPPLPTGHHFKKGPKLMFPDELTPLTHPVSAILDFAEHQGLVEYDPRFAPVYAVGDGPYCRFHRAAGHDTDECKVLKREIEFYIDIVLRKE